VRAACRIPGGLELTLEWDASLAEVIDDYLATARRFTPDVDRRLSRIDGEDALLEVSGAAGFLQSLEGSLVKRGVPVD
jgi:hypothetical protein